MTESILRGLMAALVATTLISGCGGSGSDDPDPDQFVAKVREIGDGMFAPVTDDQIMATGDAVCELSRKASSEDEYVGQFFESVALSEGITPELTAGYSLQAGYALQYLCPEQADRWGN